MTIRELYPVTADVLAAAGRVWDSATRHHRDVLVLSAYRYRAEMVLDLSWSMIGFENQKALARTMAELTELLRRAPLAPLPGLVNENIGDRSPGAASGPGWPSER